MTIYAEILAACESSDAFVFDADLLPFDMAEEAPTLPSQSIQHITYSEIIQQLNEQIREADARDPNDLWTAFWIALGAEKVVSAFVEKAHFTELIPLQAEIRRPLHERLCTPPSKFAARF
jgi:hypothetical protein